MSISNKPIPSIAITLDGDATERISSGFGKSIADALTDIEDLDSDGGNNVLTTERKPLLFAGVGGDGIVLTDSEYLEGSEDDDDYRPKTPTPLDNLLEFEGTFEELLQVTSDYKTRGQHKSKATTMQSSGGFLGLPDNGMDALTDYEDFILSDDDWIEEDLEMDDIDLDNHLADEGSVDISDRVRRSENTPSPSVTPEPGQMLGQHGKQFQSDVAVKQYTKSKRSDPNKKYATKKKIKSQFLSPKQTTEPMCDVTDTEVLPSDSDDELPEKRSVRRRKKTTLQVRGVNEEAVTDVEDLEIPADEVFKFSDMKQIRSLRKTDRSVVLISDKPLEAYLGPQEDTDSEDMSLSDRDEASPVPPRKVKYVPKTSFSNLMVATAEVDALTDVEDMEANEDLSEDESEERPASPIPKALTDIETHYGSVTVSYQTKERAQCREQVELNNGVSEHMFTGEDSDDPLTAQKRRRAVMKYLREKSRQASTDEDEMEASDGEFKRGDRGDDLAVQQDVFEVRFMEVEGEARPVIVAPGGKLPGKSKSSTLEVLATEGGLTDVEEVRSSGSSDADEDEKPDKNLLDTILTRSDSLTDVEDFEGDDDDDVLSDVSDGELDRALPEALRELTLIQYQGDGPVVITLPLPDDHHVGLMVRSNEASNYMTEVEDFSSDEQDTLAVEEPRYVPTPELPEMDFGIIDASEALKVQKKKLKPPGVSYAPLTDTEDVYLAGEPNRRKKKSKSRLLQPKVTEQGAVTDVEELDVSDAEAFAWEGIAVVRRQVGSLNIPQGNTDSATDVEDMHVSDEDPETPTRMRRMSVTPDVMKNMDYSTTTFREGSGLLGVETHHQNSGINIPKIRMISPSPDINRADHTDTEDMQASAEEDIDTFSRAETATPLELGLNMEEHSSSFVHVKHTHKLDYEAAEEAMHMKFPHSIQESHTDVEELGSEDESRLLKRISVEDTEESVCVCCADDELRGNRSVCVCVGKSLGDVSMKWSNDVSTTSQQSVNASRGQEWSGKPQDSDTARSGAEGLMSQGAAGGASYTTTETRTVEGSDDATMQELLDKLAAEQRK